MTSTESIWVNSIRLVMGEVRVIEEVIDTLGNTNGVELFKILNERIQYKRPNQIGDVQNASGKNIAPESIVYVQMIDSQKLIKLGMSISQLLKDTRSKKANDNLLFDFINELMVMLTSTVYINNINWNTSGSAPVNGSDRMSSNGSLKVIASTDPSLNKKQGSDKSLGHIRNPSMKFTSNGELPSTRTVLTSNHQGPGIYLPDNRLILRNVLYQFKLVMIFILESLQKSEVRDKFHVVDPQILNFLLLINVSIIDKLYKLFKQLDKRFVLNTEKFITAVAKS